jgi:hypothetical protein
LVGVDAVEIAFRRDPGGLDLAGRRLFDKTLPNDESRLRAMFDTLATTAGEPR